jgi:hypothetical protein
MGSNLRSLLCKDGARAFLARRLSVWRRLISRIHRGAIQLLWVHSNAPSSQSGARPLPSIIGLREHVITINLHRKAKPESKVLWGIEGPLARCKVHRPPCALGCVGRRQVPDRRRLRASLASSLSSARGLQGFASRRRSAAQYG